MIRIDLANPDFKITPAHVAQVKASLDRRTGEDRRKTPRSEQGRRALERMQATPDECLRIGAALRKEHQ